MRVAAVFVAVCMVLIAGSAGAVVYFYLGLSLSEAITVAIAILTALALYNTVSTRIGLRRAVGYQLSDLSRGGADLARQVAEMGRRLAAMEGQVGAALDRTHAATDPLSVEIDELGAMVKQLAETLAAHETRLADLARSAAMPAGSPADASTPRPDAATTGTTSATTLAPPAPSAWPELKPAAAVPPSAAPTQVEALADIRAAIDANRIDLYLQPIVTLPQRKVRYYEAMSRLRTEGGDVLHAADFVPQAESGGLMPKIDNLVVFRCVQVVRRLLLKNREIGLFCNLSGSTLTDSTVFPQFLEFMDANRAIAPSLLLEFTQSAVRTMGPIEHESLAALAERGYRFSLDNVTDLRIEPRELADRSFRFIKIPANLLLNRAGATTTDIHPADLSDLLGRFGIDLIADKIEGEGSVVDLLDYDVRYGQGFLFSAPRPVRAEALQGIAERSDVVVREAAGATDDRTALLNAMARPAEAATPSPEAGKGDRTTGLAQLARGIVSRG